MMQFPRQSVFHDVPLFPERQNPYRSNSFFLSFLRLPAKAMVPAISMHPLKIQSPIPPYSSICPYVKVITILLTSRQLSGPA